MTGSGVLQQGGVCVTFAGMRSALLQRAARCCDHPTAGGRVSLEHRTYALLWRIGSQPGDLALRDELRETASAWACVTEASTWGAALVLGALGQAVARLLPEEHPRLARCIAGRAAAVAETPISHALERVAWAWAVRRACRKPRKHGPEATLTDASALASQHYLSGMLRSPGPGGEVPDLERTVRAGCLGLVLALREESPSLKEWAARCLAAVAVHITAQGTLLWNEPPEFETLWWAVLGLHALGSVTNNPAHADAARRLIGWLGRRYDAAGVGLLSEVSVFRLADLWSEAGLRGEASAERAVEWPQQQSIPDSAIALSHAADRSLGWWWVGDHAPVVAGALGRHPGFIRCGPCTLEGGRVQWALASGRPSWEQAMEVDERRYEGDALVWSGHVAVAVPEEEHIAWLTATGYLCPDALALRVHAPAALRKRLLWRAELPNVPGIRTITRDGGAAVRFPHGETWHFRWTPASLRAMIEWNPGEGGSLLVGPPLPSEFALGDKGGLARLEGLR